MTPANPSTRGPINDGWIVFGTMLITGANVVWAGDLRVDPIRKKGGKK